MDIKERVQLTTSYWNSFSCTSSLVLVENQRCHCSLIAFPFVLKCCSLLFNFHSFRLQSYSLIFILYSHHLAQKSTSNSRTTPRTGIILETKANQKVILTHNSSGRAQLFPLLGSSTIIASKRSLCSCKQTHWQFPVFLFICKLLPWYCPLCNRVLMLAQ